jgi:hypothetical protein
MTNGQAMDKIQRMEADAGRPFPPAERLRMIAQMTSGSGQFTGQMPSVASRTPEETKALETAAAEAAKFEADQQRARFDAEQAAAKARAEAEAKAGVEREGLEPKRRERVRLATTGIQNVIDTIDEAVNQVGPASAGVVGAATKGIPGTPAYTLAKTAMTIKANIGFDRLQQMRDASPTGGALGQIAIQELDALQSSIASLDQGLDPAALASNMKKVKRHYTAWLNAVKMADQRDSARAGGQPETSAKQVKRTGTLNGRKVIEYTDGTTAYAD